jgi:RNA polymerase sigma factor (sigma-70 family)
MCAPLGPGLELNLARVLDGTDDRIARHVVRRMKVRPALVPDALQVARLAVVVAARSYSPVHGRTWAGWAVRLACQRVGDLLAEASRNTFTPADLDDLDRGDPASGLRGQERDPLQAVAGSDLWRLIDRLPPRQGEAVRLRFAGGARFDRVAAALGLADRSAARKLVARALANLRKLAGAAG